MNTRTNYAGKTVVVDINDPTAPSGPQEYRVEGYWDEITGKSWLISPVIAALNYMVRSEAKGLPMDDEVLYGKIGPFGYLVHVSEIVSE